MDIKIPKDTTTNKEVIKTENDFGCFKCKYFFITWDRANPRGCRAHGFKSPEVPSVIVFESSGIECQFFVKKATS